MSSPVLVRIEETGDDEVAFVDGAPISRVGDESAREAALRTVVADLVEPRTVDIHTPSGVVLHLEAHPDGRLQVLGQSVVPRRDPATDRSSLLGGSTTVGSRDGRSPSAADGDATSPTGGGSTHADPLPAADDDSHDDWGWDERDQAWPHPGADGRAETRVVPTAAATADPDPRSTHDVGDTHDIGDTRDVGGTCAVEDGLLGTPAGDLTVDDMGDDIADDGSFTSPGPRPHETSGSVTVAGLPVVERPTTPSGDTPTTPSPGGPDLPHPETSGDDTTPAPAREAELDPDPESEPTPDPENDDDPSPGTPRRRPPRGARLAAVLCGVLGIGAVGAATVLHRDPAPAVEPVVTGHRFPQTPPDGWGAQASWASPPLDPASLVAVSKAAGSTTPAAAAVHASPPSTGTNAPATTGSAATATATTTSTSTTTTARSTTKDSGQDASVAFVTASHAVTVVDAATGRPRWNAALPKGELVTGPALTRLDGVDAFAVQVGRHALVWAVRDGRALADVELPPRAELVAAGSAPMVRLTTTRAALLTSTGLDEVEVPVGATSLAGREDGTVLVASPKGWWHVAPAKVAGDPTPWEPIGSPRNRPTSAPTVVGMVGSSVVLVHPDPTTPRLVVHHDGVSVRPSFQDVYVPSRQPTWAPSPSGTWGVLGRSLVDVEAGQVVDLGDWRTVYVGDDQAYGMVGDTLARTAPGAWPTPVAVRSALVEATTPAGGLVRATSPEGTRVWSLPRAAG